MTPDSSLSAIHLELNRRHFSTSAAGYDFNQGQVNVRLYRARYALRCMRRYGIPRNMRVLDVGCSEGLVLRAMAPSIREGMGVDIASLPIELARERAAQNRIENLVFKECLLEELDDRDFDTAVCFETIEHVPDPVAFLRAIHARLKAHGTLILSTPNYLRACNRVARWLGKSMGVCDPTHFHEYSMPELAALVTNAGFQVQRQSGMILLESSLTHRLAGFCISRRVAQRLMESMFSIHLGRLLKSQAFVQLLVARKAS
jgi:ubiquinone biosynthesis O-methyltransferase